MGKGGVDFKVSFVLVELDYLYLIVGALDERTQRNPHVLPQLTTEVDGVEREIRFVGVDLLSLGLRLLVQSQSVLLLLVESEVLLVLHCQKQLLLLLHGQRGSVLATTQSTRKLKPLLSK